MRAHGGSAGSGSSITDAEVLAELEQLRGYSEFSALEDEYGTFNLSVDRSLESSQYDPGTHTIQFQPGDLNLEFPTTMSPGFEQGLQGLSDGAYWNAIDSYPQWQRFSVKRILFHEGFHATQPSSGLRYQLNPGSFEGPAIQRTNQFMHQNFGEPYRANDHNRTRIGQ